MPEREVPIYHMTHIENLPSIIDAGGLWCDTEREKRRLVVYNIAHAEIKARRKIKEVHVAAGGVLADYVPFYFANRTPMLYAIHQGFVSNCTATQDELVYLISSVETVALQDCQWCFTDGHAIERVTRYFADVSDLQQLDWEVLHSNSWGDTLDDPDRKRRKQAEFLIHGFFSWEWITRIAVKGPDDRSRLLELLTSMGQTRQIWQQPKWYYSDHD